MASGPGAVLGDGHVDVGDDDLPGHDRVEPGVRGEDLLGERERRHGAAPARRPPAGAAARGSPHRARASPRCAEVVLVDVHELLVEQRPLELDGRLAHEREHAVAVLLA